MVLTRRYLTLCNVICLGVLFATFTGCAMNSASFAVSAPSPSNGYTLRGTVQLPSSATGAHLASDTAHSSPPIGGAHVYLFSAGVSGYGSQAQLLALTTTTTDGGASFQFTNDPNHVNSLTNVTSTYSCPSYTFSSPDGTTSITADSLIYIVASGGDTVDSTGSSHNNKHSVLMAALGDCQSLVGNEPFVNINAVTTVASVDALSPYINPVYPDTTYNGTFGYFAGGGLGTAATYMTNYGTEVRGGYTATGSKKSVATLPLGYIGMKNAFATVNRLVNLSSGVAVQSFTHTASLTGGTVTVTGTPEAAKLNSLADAITTCVYSSDDQFGNASNACTTLFGYTSSSDTGTSLGYSATLPSTTDTLQFAYYTAINPFGGQGGASTSTKVNGIYSLVNGASDFQPTISSPPTDWTLSIAYTSSSNCGSAPTAQPFLSASPGFVATDLSGGVVLANATSGNNTVVALDNTGSPTACQFGTIAIPGGAVLDAGDNVWFSVPGSNSIYRSSSGTVLTVPTTGITPYGLALDAAGNLYAAGGSTGNIYKLPGAQTAVTAPTPTTAFSYSFPGPVLNVALDNAGDIFTVSENNPGSALVAQYSSGSYTVHTASTVSAFLNPVAVAIDSFGGIITASTAQTGAYSSDTDYVTYSSQNGFNVFPGSVSGGGLAGANSVALDGAGNMWFGNSLPAATYTSGSQTLNLFGISESRSNGSPTASSHNPYPVSPAASSSCPGNQTTNCYLGGGYQKTTLGSARSIAVDISGNVWVPADLSSNSVANGNLVEIIGSAVPSVQPLAVAVRDNLVSTLIP